MRLIAIDPGPKESAYVAFEADTKWGGRGKIFGKAIISNAALERRIPVFVADDCSLFMEDIRGYGMKVGNETFDTVRAIARFELLYDLYADKRRKEWEPHNGKQLLTERIARPDWAAILCNSSHAKDSDVRAALLDRWGGEGAAIGDKKNPGPLYGLKTHLWSALGLAAAIEVREQRKGTHG